MITQVIAAFVGTVAFALLFSVPAKDYMAVGTIGALGWGIFYALNMKGVSEVFSLFWATIVVVFLARYAAVVFQAPSTIFLIPGIFPLVPGGKIFYAGFHFLSGETVEALNSGAEALRCAFAIVLGIMIILRLPGRFFKSAAVWKRNRFIF